MDPNKILPLDLWVLVCANATDYAVLTGLEKLHADLKSMFNSPPDSVYNISGITKPPAVVIEYSQIMKECLNYKKVLLYNSFKTFSYNLMDVKNYKKNKESNFEEISLDLNNQSARVIVPSRIRSYRTLSLTVKLSGHHLPPWMPIMYLVQYSGFAEEINAKDCFDIYDRFQYKRVSKSFTWGVRHNSVNVGSNSLINLRTFEKSAYYRRFSYHPFRYMIPVNRYDSHFISIKEIDVTWAIDIGKLSARLALRKRKAKN